MLLSAFAFLLIGAYITAEFKEDSLAGFPATLTDRQTEQLLQELHGKAAVCLDHPVHRAIVLKTALRDFRIVTAEQSPAQMGLRTEDHGDSGRHALSSYAPSVYRYDAVFQRYTFFAIPIGKTTINASDDIRC